jgi:hypothetical protein
MIVGYKKGLGSVMMASSPPHLISPSPATFLPLLSVDEIDCALRLLDGRNVVGGERSSKLYRGRIGCGLRTPTILTFSRP